MHPTSVRPPQGAGRTRTGHRRRRTSRTLLAALTCLANDCGYEEVFARQLRTYARPGDLVLVLAGLTDKVRKQLNELRLEIGGRLGLRDKNSFAPLWVLDFPLLEWDEESERYHAMHHPFTSPKPEDIAMLDTEPGEVRANAYDLVINGTEIGGGSIRIHDKALQSLMFKHLGFLVEKLKRVKIGFLDLGNLKPGAYRTLTSREVERFRKLLHLDSGEHAHDE